MSVYTKCPQCGVDLSALELLLSLFRVDAEGNIGMEVKLNVCSEDSTPAAKCGIDTTLEQVIKGSIVLDECGHCSLKLFVDPTSIGALIRANQDIIDYICDECDQR